jgi:hypothetical protein
MPLDPDEAELFRARAHEHRETFWCGHLLGGCGGQLSLKIVRERETVPHFAHRADSNECARLRKGGEGTRGGHSADHLYAHRHLRTWLSDRAANARADYVGVDKGRACTQLVVPTTTGKDLRLVFTHDLDHDLLDLAKSPEAHAYVWLVRANQAITRALVANGVPYRRFRLTDADGLTRTVQVGIRDGAGEVVWTPLGECVLQGDTLVKARTEAAPVPAQRRPEHREATAPADPLEQALRGLHHALDQQDAANIRAMAHQVQMRLRQARAQGLARHLFDEARTLLEQAAAALPAREAVPAPRRAPVVPARRRQDRRRTVLPHDRVRREADKHIGKLQWAAERRLNQAYNDNRAALVGLLSRPDVPKDVTDWIKQHLREFPKGQFDRPASAPPVRKTRRQAAAPADRGRGARPAQRADGVRARTDELFDTLQWAYDGRMPQTFGDTRAQLLGILGRSSTPGELKDKIRVRLDRFPEALAVGPAPAPAPPPKKPQASQKQNQRSRGRGGRSTPQRRTSAASAASGAGLLDNARIDERSRQRLEQLRAAPRPSPPEGDTD